MKEDVVLNSDLGVDFKSHSCLKLGMLQLSVFPYEVQDQV